MKGTGCEEANEALKEPKPRKSDVPTPTGLRVPEPKPEHKATPPRRRHSHWRESLREEEGVHFPAEKAQKRSLGLSAALQEDVTFCAGQGGGGKDAPSSYQGG